MSDTITLSRAAVLHAMLTDGHECDWQEYVYQTGYEGDYRCSICEAVASAREIIESDARPAPPDPRYVLNVERLGRALHSVYCRGRAPMHSDANHSAAAIAAAYAADKS